MESNKMRTIQLISIACFTIATVFTIYAWMERISGTNAKINEAFQDVLDDAIIAKIQANNEPVPTPEEADKAYQTLLRFIRNDFTQGIKFIQDLNDRLYEYQPSFKKDLDIRRLMENYTSPLQRA